MTAPDLERLRNNFAHFLTETREQASPLYEEITRHILSDREMLAIAAEVGRPPEPNLLFAAVHFLLMGSPHEALAAYYGSLAKSPRAPTGAYPTFRDFVLSHRSDVVALLRTRITQTNEVRRSAYLMLAFTHIYESAGRKPLALIDIGCSAGLHLLWDRYRYDFDIDACGDADSPTRIDCALRGDKRPRIPDTMPPCAFRLGIDLNPIDLTDAVERRWLEAMLWPEHADRRRLTSAAISLALDDPPPMIRGDATKILREHLAAVPDDCTLVVYHCHALCQVQSHELDLFGRDLEELSHRREVYLLSAEGHTLRLQRIVNGETESSLLARKDPHGRWVEWLVA
jgi:hypothetical protein